MNKSLKQNVRFLIVLVPLIVAGIGFGWYKFQTDPQRVFNGMLQNNLMTSAITKTVESDSKEGNGTLQQINLQLGANNHSRWLTTLRTNGTTVVTEGIGTPKADYVRYTSISDKAGNSAYTDAVNVWAKTSGSGNNGTPANMFSGSLLDLTLAPVPPLGLVADPQRGDMVAFMQDQQVFTVDYGKVTAVTVGGRKAYEFPVKVKLAPYVRLMQAFAHSFGLKELDSLSASQYQDAQPSEVKIAVDILSHRMLRLTFPATGFSETFSDYGIAHSVQPPTKTITASELQRLFDAGE